LNKIYYRKEKKEFISSEAVDRKTRCILLARKKMKSNKN